MDAFCSYVGDQTRPTAHNFKKSKLERTNIESLPDDVVFGILARVPAHDIRHAARLVCRKWYQTTRTRDFVRAQLQQSTCGLLIQHDGSESSLFATQPKGQRIFEKTKYKLTGDALSSCNGLILEQHGLEFCVTNPTTKQHLDLPLFPLEGKIYLNYVIACDVASKEYKVVVTTSTNAGGGLECAILTVGVDKDWKRRVDIQHLSPTAKMLLTKCPSTTQGFVHWASNSCFPDGLTLNVETEIITKFPAVPPPSLCGYGGETKLLYNYLPMGSYLSLLIARADECRILDQIWVMKPETGEWTKMMSIDSESLKRALQGNYTVYPAGWLKFREVLVLRSWNWSSRAIIAYNVRTHETESSFELDFIPKICIAHRNSLVWLD